MIVQGRRKGEVTFVCKADNHPAKVFLCGEFNSWNPEDTRMKRQKDGTYRAKLKLEPGEYQYKFVVDGQWQNDPEADGQIINEFGSANSVARV
jgi:1,4-alpha-glucan branching enzyme